MIKPKTFADLIELGLGQGMFAPGIGQCRRPDKGPTRSHPARAV
jgi:hypothetical protein